MQATLRDQGKESMNKDVYDSFVDAYENDTLLKPEQPGYVIAEFVADPSKELSGKSVKYGHTVSHSCSEDDMLTARHSWNSPELAPWKKEEEKEVEAKEAKEAQELEVKEPKEEEQEEKSA